MPDIALYQQSIAAEFLAQKDRVRFFIDDAHWGEDGRYKEILLSDFLKNIVPNNVGIGTGFVRNADGELTKQIDIIIYKKDFPCLFKKGDFVIVMPESVLGIIEVKSKTSVTSLTGKKQKPKSVIEICEENGRIIGSKQIFNGIWGYDSKIKFNDRFNNSEIRTQLHRASVYLNHICFSSDLFCRFWENGNPIDRDYDPRPCFSFYELSWNQVTHSDEVNKPGFAYGYFISNILECIYRQIQPQVLNNQYFEFLYPLKYSKEAYRFKEYDIKLDV